MIKGITIENFKGIGPPIHLDLKPVTMLFGSNSAGKSTIFHAVLLAYEVLVNRNRNPDATTVGGNNVDLGGFQTFIHKDASGDDALENSVVLEFDLDLSNEQLHIEHPISELLVGGKNPADIAEIGIDVWSAKVRLQLAWDFKRQLPFISEYAISLDDQPLGRITCSAGGESARLEELNLRHPVVAWPEKIDVAEQGSIGLLDFLDRSIRTVDEERFFNGNEVSLTDIATARETYAHVLDFESETPDEELTFHESEVFLDGQAMILVLQCDRNGIVSTRRVALNEPKDADTTKAWTAEGFADVAKSWINTEERNERPVIRLRLDPDAGLSDALPNWTSLLDLDLVPEELTDDSERTGEIVRSYQQSLINLLTRLMVVPGRILARELESIRHIGPFRKIPPRNHRPRLSPDRARWANGLAAWDTLYTADDELVEKVSSWMSRSEDGLATGYGLHRRRFRELPSDSFVMRTLLEDDSPLDQIELIRESLENIPEEKRLFLRDEETLVEVEPHDIAIGITQVVPVVVAAVDGHDGITTIEQPEIHNHPSVEVGLGDLFISTIAEGQDFCRFILETHGEHVILRMLRRIRETSENELPDGHRGLRPDEIAVYYVERNAHGVKVHHMRIDETGEFIDKWPEGGFFRERAKELF